MERKYVIIFLLFVCFSNLNAQHTLTLQQCIDSALENNRQIKSQSLIKQEREIAYRQARQNLLPGLNAGASQNFSFGRSIDASNTYQSDNSIQTSFNVSSNLTIFDGLKMKYSIDARKAEMHASQADLEKIKDDITLAVNAAFLEVLMNKELLQIAQEQLEITQQNVERQKILLKSKKITEGDLYELLAQESKENLRCIEADNNLKISLLNLAQIIELSPQNPPHGDFDFDIIAPDDLSNNLVLLSIETVYENALKNRPEIKSAEYRLQSSKKNVLIARSDYYPTLSLEANFGTSYFNLENMQNQPFEKQLSKNLSSSVGLSLSIPVFNRFYVSNRVKSAKLEVKSSELNKDNARAELYKTIQQACLNANAAKSRWDATIKSETAAREAYRFALQKFETGRTSQYELFQAKSFLMQALSEKAQAKYEYFFRLKIVAIYNH